MSMNNYSPIGVTALGEYKGMLIDWYKIYYYVFICWTRFLYLSVDSNKKEQCEYNQDQIEIETKFKCYYFVLPKKEPSIFADNAIIMFLFTGYLIQCYFFLWLLKEK